MHLFGRPILLLGAALLVAGSAEQARAQVTKSSNSPAIGAQGEVDLAKYALSMENMRKLTAAMQAMKATDAEVEMDDDDSLQQAVAKVEHNQAAMAALQKAGMAPRDYVLTLTTYLATAMVVAFQKQDPKFKTPEGVSAKNIEFVGAHWAELERMSKQAGLSQP